MAGPELAVGMAGLSLAGAGMEAFGKIQAGDSAVRAADIEAGGQERAGALSQAAGFEQGRMRRYTGQLVQGQQVAGYSAAGVDANSGSSLLTRLETAKQVELDALKQEFSGLESNRVARQQADLTRYGGRVAKYNARSAAIGSILGGASKAMLFAQAGMQPKPTGQLSSFNANGSQFLVNAPR